MGLCALGKLYKLALCNNNDQRSHRYIKGRIHRVHVFRITRIILQHQQAEAMAQQLINPKNVPWHRLPDEVSLQILKEYLKFPRGLHSDRWLIIKRVRLDRLVGIKQIEHIVPEALYTQNPVVLRPYNDNMEFRNPRKWHGLDIKYPARPHNTFVRNLQYHFQLKDAKTEIWAHVSDPKIPLHPTVRLFQIEWLKRLGNDEFGFENLEVIGLVFEQHKLEAEWLVYLQLHQLIQELRLVGGLQFHAKRLQIMITGHLCEGEHEPQHECAQANELKKLITVSSHLSKMPAYRAETIKEIDENDPWAWTMSTFIEPDGAPWDWNMSF
jgi:hypothetical protein